MSLVGGHLPTPRPEISVIAPVYNNARSLPALCERIRAAFVATPIEIILVDDRSTDASRDVIARLDVRAVLRPHNGGQNAAILDGLRAARGRICCVLDADLEDPPEGLPPMVAALEREAAGIAFSSREEPRRADSVMFRRVLHRLYPSLPPQACLCFAIDRPSRDRLLAAAAPGDYLPAVIGALGIPATQVAVARRPRPWGDSAYAGWGRYRYAVRVLRSAARLRWAHRKGSDA